MDLNEECACGSGKKAGACCMRAEECDCGSGKKAGECCYAHADTDGGGGADIEFDMDEM